MLALTLNRIGSLFLGLGFCAACLCAVIHLVNYLRPSTATRVRLALHAHARDKRPPRFGHPGSVLVAGAWFGCGGWFAYSLGLRGPLALVWVAVTLVASCWGAVNAWYARSQV